jgi:hypothetical protein
MPEKKYCSKKSRTTGRNLLKFGMDNMLLEAKDIRKFKYNTVININIVDANV